MTLPPFLRVDVRVGLCKLSRILPRQGRVEIRCQFPWGPRIFGIEFQYFILSVLQILSRFPSILAFPVVTVGWP
jgi:hypothetical protein